MDNILQAIDNSINPDNEVRFAAVQSLELFKTPEFFNYEVVQVLAQPSSKSINRLFALTSLRDFINRYVEFTPPEILQLMQSDFPLILIPIH